MRLTPLVTGEYYHLYNRGVEKRNIVVDKDDSERFLLGIQEFNTLGTIGSLHECLHCKEKGQQTKSTYGLVDIICFCLNPNHYHLLVRQNVDKGIEQFMHRQGTGYTKYFNHKYKRKGSLFEGTFKASHVDTNEYLLHVSAYINLNDRCHQLGSSSSKLVRSSWKEFQETSGESYCKKDIILEQFSSLDDYRDFAESSLADIVQRKELEKELSLLLIERE
jgi:putative transposase